MTDDNLDRDGWLVLVAMAITIGTPILIGLVAVYGDHC